MSNEIRKDFENFTNQKQWEKYLKWYVAFDDKALHRAIVIIYDLQTDSEKLAGATKEHNGLGFSMVDAETFSKFAKRIKKGEKLEYHELCLAKIVMPKYWKQLMNVSKARLAARKEKQKQLMLPVIIYDQVLIVRNACDLLRQQQDKFKPYEGTQLTFQMILEA